MEDAKEKPDQVSRTEKKTQQEEKWRDRARRGSVGRGGREGRIVEVEGRKTLRG